MGSQSSSVWATGQPPRVKLVGTSNRVENVLMPGFLQTLEEIRTRAVETVQAGESPEATPIDSEYCDNRKALQAGLTRHGFQLRYMNNQKVAQSELPQALSVSVLGLAFRDFEHNRGSAEVGTPWELHPAEVSLKQ